VTTGRSSLDIHHQPVGLVTNTVYGQNNSNIFGGTGAWPDPEPAQPVYSHTCSFASSGLNAMILFSLSFKMQQNKMNCMSLFNIFSLVLC
jgi:hypothetical protein